MFRMGIISSKGFHVTDLVVYFNTSKLANEGKSKIGIQCLGEISPLTDLTYPNVIMFISVPPDKVKEADEIKENGLSKRLQGIAVSHIAKRGMNVDGKYYPTYKNVRIENGFILAENRR